jgi:hypothetical protein
MTETPQSPETVRSFVDRMTTQTPQTISDDDWSTLLAIFIIGSQRMVELGGQYVLVPSSQ